MKDNCLLFLVQICNVDVKNMGIYQCDVDYSIPDDSQLYSASTAADVTVGRCH
jgi:hypothetical protein